MRTLGQEIFYYLGHWSCLLFEKTGWSWCWKSYQWCMHTSNRIKPWDKLE